MDDKNVKIYSNLLRIAGQNMVVFTGITHVVLVSRVNMFKNLVYTDIKSRDFLIGHIVLLHRALQLFVLVFYCAICFFFILLEAFKHSKD